MDASFAMSPRPDGRSSAAGREESLCQMEGRLGSGIVRMAMAHALPWLSAVTRDGRRLLEPDAGKLARPVLRGGGGREVSSLPDVRPESRVRSS